MTIPIAPSEVVASVSLDARDMAVMCGGSKVCGNCSVERVLGATCITMELGPHLNLALAAARNGTPPRALHSASERTPPSIRPTWSVSNVIVSYYICLTIAVCPKLCRYPDAARRKAFLLLGHASSLHRIQAEREAQKIVQQGEYSCRRLASA